MLTASDLAALLHDAIRLCVTHRPTTALQLSGGLDSAIIQAVAELDHCYCCTWPELDNLTMARVASQGSEVIPVTFTREEMIEVALPEVARITRGRGTWSQCCQWFLGRAMAKDGMRVVLNGEGADEFWFGYSRYRVLYWIDRARRDPHLEEYYGVVCDTLAGNAPTVIDRFLKRNGGEGLRLLPSGDDFNLVEVAALHDQDRPLAELLDFEYRIAREHGLDHRWPFMDEMVRAAAATCSTELKISDQQSKAILRTAARVLGVPEDIINEKTKRGLVVPPEWGTGRKWSRDWFTDLMRDAWMKQAS